ncbi:MAG: zinc ribbon domain-containing protein [Deltaproteobacteria bacterium]|nr:zinc ribbon domain-containing protein [Deltaproteobacteria bacterium]
MPIYEYHCLNCSKDHEIIQKASDKPLRKCPSCSGKMQKKMSLSSFQLKGGGWYASGYSKEAEKKVEKKVEKAAVPVAPASPKSPENKA